MEKLSKEDMIYYKKLMATHKEKKCSITELKAEIELIKHGKNT